MASFGMNLSKAADSQYEIVESRKTTLSQYGRVWFRKESAMHINADLMQTE